MKSIKKKIVGFLSLILITPPLAAGAAEIADVKFEKQYTAPETALELKGVGLLRYLGLFKVYAGAFYLEEGTPTNEALTDRAKRLEVEYLRSFKGE
ncbi:MAG: chalcone isomerase family protein, partial [Desulfobacterales bacterium]